MKFKEIIDKVAVSSGAFAQGHDTENSRHSAALKLVQKSGEFAQAILIHDKKCRPEKYRTAEEAREKIAEKLEGIVVMAIINAHLYGINLEESIHNKWLKKEWSDPVNFGDILREMVENALNYGRIHQVPIDQEFATLKLSEEIGEFAEAVLVYNEVFETAESQAIDEARRKLAEELADVIGMAAVNGHVYGVDLEEMLKKKYS